jgi:hypothetical protein
MPPVIGDSKISRKCTVGSISRREGFVGLAARRVADKKRL